MGNSLPHPPEALPTDPGRLPPATPGPAGALFRRPRVAPAPPQDFVRIDLPATEPLDSIGKSLLICGDAVEALDVPPEASAQTVVPSPP